MATYSTPYDWAAGDFATEARMDQISNNFLALLPVGFYAYICRAATTSETFVNGVWLECNGLSVLRATYPDLNTLLSSLSYPFGTADGTHMTLPDFQGRAPVSMASGGHADVNAIGDSDGVAKATRTPHHNTTSTLSVSVGSLAVSPSSHSHTYTGAGTANNATPGSGIFGVTSQPTNTTSAQSLTIAGSPTLSGTVGAGGTGPSDLSPWLVGGTLFVKAVT